MSGLLEVQGLRAGYGRTEVLRGVDLSVGQGEIVVLLAATARASPRSTIPCADCSGPGAAACASTART